MFFIDTHAHLYSEEFDEDRASMVQRARDNHIEKVCLPNVDSKSIAGMLALERDYPDMMYPMMGLHPCSVKPDSWKEELAIVEEWLNKRSFVAVGEIGMDLYWDVSTREIQAEAFRIQCHWAVLHDIPVVIHSREATRPLIDLIQSMSLLGLRGIFHCFSGTLEEARSIVELGFLLGIGGPLTYKKSNLPDILTEIDISHLVLETDSPYLPPTPHRGKRNESAYIPLIAVKLAEVKGVSVEEVAHLTSANARQLFRLDEK
jgi:TatD DNase family protein